VRSLLVPRTAGWHPYALTATARDDKAFMQAGAEELTSCWMASLAALH
jgi:hypothetical protein